ncbi:unnamed protein product, partial [marine sediment metagenome]
DEYKRGATVHLESSYILTTIDWFLNEIKISLIM